MVELPVVLFLLHRVGQGYLAASDAKATAAALARDAHQVDPPAQRAELPDHADIAELLAELGAGDVDLDQTR